MLKNQSKFLAAQETWKQIEDGVFAIVGSPQTVRDKLRYWLPEIGAGNILLGCQVGSMTHEQARRSLRLFAERFFRRSEHPASTEKDSEPART